MIGIWELQLLWKHIVVLLLAARETNTVAGGDGKLVLKTVTKSALVDGAKASYASKVIDDKARNSKACPSLFREEVIVYEKDVIVDQSTLIPAIRFSDRVHDQVDHSMRNALIVQLLGSYLKVQSWNRSFSPSENYPSQVIVWVRFSAPITLPYYTNAMFRCIVDVLARVVKIDYNTQEGGCNKFACLALIVDLNKLLRSCIHIDGKLQRIEYEGLQQVCFVCGIYGHAKE
ncbi:hypothetical protein GQ457_05G028520 [Hibiscus cannabinus]